MTKLTIGLDVHSIGSEKGGNETYYRELARGLASIRTQHHFFLYYSARSHGKRLNLDGEFSNRQFWPIHPALRIPLSAPWCAHRDRLDVYHAQYILPPFLNCKTVVSIFDLAHERFPEFFHPIEARRSHHLIRWSARRADHVITVSRFSAQDLEELYGVSPEKITVTHLAAGKEFRLLDAGVCTELILRKYGLSAPFILYAGRLQARKNLPRLVQAYAQLKKRGIQEKLVLVGKRDWKSDDLLEAVREQNLTSDVVFVGYVPGEDLPHFYNAASVFVFPSIFEGFGLPIVESMACGTPTITSQGSSLEEVAGDAAVLVDPLSVVSIANAIEKVLGSAGLRQDLREKGLRRASDFSYQLAAAQTVRVYENL